MGMDMCDGSLLPSDLLTHLGPASPAGLSSGCAQLTHEAVRIFNLEDTGSMTGGSSSRSAETVVRKL